MGAPGVEIRARKENRMLAAGTLADYLSVAEEAARRGAAVLEEWRLRFRVREKSRFDLVTDADLASQQAIRETIARRFPDHGFLGEEDLRSHGRPAADAAPTWIVDPLDGTTNYVHDVPLYCISIGLQVAGDLVAGVVLDPCRQELFRAACGQGAWLGSERLQVSSIDHLEQAMLATGFPPDMRGQERLLEWWRYFSLRAQSLRRTGSTALNLAYLAAGRFDGYWAFDNHVWDVAAGAVLVREAGGIISNLDGSSYDPYRSDTLAASSGLYPVLLAALQWSAASGGEPPAPPLQ
jgi:myo-inositol-1(or 4)-monophosphatase